MRNWKRDPLVARILRRWRELTGDKRTRDDQRRTLVACSGGADSVALGFALSRSPGSCVLAHIRHDLRSPQETAADLELVRAISQQWGVPCVSEDLVIAHQPGNVEANARRGRYTRLAELARKHECRFVGTGHHGDDQLETLLMHLVRGSGIPGMSGMAEKRDLGGVTLIRPMLGVSRAEIIGLLGRARLGWCEDPTNAETDLLRNRLRHEVVPSLRAICPQIGERARSWGADLGAVREMIEGQADGCISSGERVGDALIWTREAMRALPDPVLGLLPHRVCGVLCAGRGMDTIGRDAVRSWGRALKSDSTDPTTHRIGPMVSEVTARSVRFAPAHKTHEETRDE